MTTNRRISLGLLCIAWIGVGVAFVGALSIPRRYCNEFPVPSGEVVVWVSLAVAGCALMPAGLLQVAEDYNILGLLKMIAIGAATVAGGVAVVMLTLHRTASWACG
jgi:hypothetical protein